ncbi:hypothetical protein ACLOJK_041861, partial [Asimina triloba]
WAAFGCKGNFKMLDGHGFIRSWLAHVMSIGSWLAHVSVSYLELLTRAGRVERTVLCEHAAAERHMGRGRQALLAVGFGSDG